MSPELCTVGHMQRRVSPKRLRENAATASTEPLDNRAEMIDRFLLSSIVIISGERSVTVTVCFPLAEKKEKLVDAVIDENTRTEIKESETRYSWRRQKQ